MHNRKYRHELKHPINEFDVIGLITRLSHVAKPDSHGDSEGTYQVRTLYFDNLYDKALMEKVNGVPSREKFRIRYYGEDLSLIKLEKKSKYRGLCHKTSAPLTQDQCQNLLKGNLDFLMESSMDLHRELYAKMRSQQLTPKSIVDYTRRAFTYSAGNVRITIDRNIRGSDQVQKFLDPTFNGKAIIHDIILEVKYDHFLPHIMASATQMPNRQAVAFSKYATCRTKGEYI
ncbi:MAG: molecular chaperone [Firmicutes bacterium HGW-Firmicutes-2]|jgi:hypothetical protein|nr:MAG: molecular chaperone [Firmicutes bacterium HGW-Firmicutes-2]